MPSGWPAGYGPTSASAVTDPIRDPAGDLTGNPDRDGRDITSNTRLAAAAAGGWGARVLLCDTALSLLAEQGLVRFDIDTVDARAGLPAGTCRQHFPNYGALYAAVLEHTAVLYQAELRECCDRHPHDVATGVADWILHAVGPARQRSQVAWTLLLDRGARAQTAMYADALQTRWDREVASHLPLPFAQARLAWTMIEGVIGRSVMNDLPIPTRDTLAAHIRALLNAHADS